MTIACTVHPDQSGNTTITILDTDEAPIRRVSKVIELGEDTTVEVELAKLVRFWNLAGKSQLYDNGVEIVRSNNS